MGLSILMSVIHANDIPRETAAEARNRKSIQQCHVNRGWPFPNVIRRSRGCALVKRMLSHCSAGGGFCQVQILFIQDGSLVVSQDARHAAD